MFSSFRLSDKSESIMSLFTGSCWPSSRNIDDISSSETSSNWQSCDQLEVERTDFPEQESRSVRDIRNKGYGIVYDFFGAIQHANEKHMSKQWSQFESELLQIETGDRPISEQHTSPNDIQYYGESYGSLPDRLSDFMAIINAKDSPFHCELPRIAKANDTIPSHLMDRLKKHPEIRKTIIKHCEDAKVDRALSPIFAKQGAQNPLTVKTIEAQINKLDTLLPEAREFDEATPCHGDLCDCNDRAVYQLENLQAKLIMLKNDLKQLDFLNTQNNLNMIDRGGRV